MARDFNGSSDKIDFGSLGVADSDALSVFCRVYLDSVTGLRTAMCRGSDGFGSGWSMYLAAQSDKIDFSIVTSDGGVAQRQALGATTLSTGQWYSFGGTWSPGSYVKAYLNGVEDGSVSTSANTMRDSTVGVQAGNINGANFLDGRIADIGVWIGVLSAADHASLHRGYTAPMIRPDIMSDAFDLGGRNSPERGRFGGSGTLTGTAYIDHPRVIYPRRKQVVVASAAAATTFGFLRDNAGVGAMGGGPFSRSNAGLGVLA